MVWTKDRVISKLNEIKQKGFIPIPDGMYRNDDGIVGQIIEREFGVHENNLHIADLGTYELKGKRINKKSKSMLTLFHKTSDSGMTPLEIFERFAYEKPSNRTGELKRKLFTTINGIKENSKHFILNPNGVSCFDLYYQDEYLATWDITDGLSKIQQVLLVLAETQGRTNAPDERFHYTKAFILGSPKNIIDAVRKGAVVMDLCIDQPADRSVIPHDRGPHIRIKINRLSDLFDYAEQVL